MEHTCIVLQLQGVFIFVYILFHLVFIVKTYAPNYSIHVDVHLQYLVWLLKIFKGFIEVNDWSTHSDSLILLREFQNSGVILSRHLVCFTFYYLKFRKPSIKKWSSLHTVVSHEFKCLIAINYLYGFGSFRVRVDLYSDYYSPVLFILSIRFPSQVVNNSW